MGKKKAAKAGTTSRKPPKATRSAPRAEKGGRGAPADGDAELLARLLVLQERTAEVSRQLRSIGELVSTVMRDATLSTAAVIEQLGGAVDAESPEPPPVAARPRRRPPPSSRPR
ncbi:MAG TPA: hypothetical protein VH134_17495 [Candidatus Dormibacteraeota bacterium]|jgi:hypothetical protein|nr:hypothetical protein [Candidatus Dormibacteraeota bacterium]